MYMPLSDRWNETHTDVHLPTDAASGYYRIWSIVNGIPCKWYEECTEVEESSELKVKSEECGVYPNPSTAVGVYFQLKSEILKDKTTITIYDLSGRVIKNLG